MIASVHIADVGPRRAITARRPTAPGLVHADVGLAAPLGGSMIPKLMPGRLGTFTFWDDDAALDRHLATHPRTDGWSARLEPLRRFGTWPGLPEEVPRSRKVDHDGPAVVLTLGRARISRLVSFVRTSNAAENAVVGAAGLRWTSGFAKPPFFATCSIWDSDDALMAYAYGDDPGHPRAIDTDRAKPFHHQSAFVRFRPYDVHGSLDGRNPLPADVL